MHHRRQALLTGLAGLFGTGRVSGIEPTAKPLPLSFSLYGMRDLSPVKAIESLAQMGYQGIEIPALPGFATDPTRCTLDTRRDIRKALSDNGLTLGSVMESLPYAEDAKILATYPDRIQRAVELFHDVSPEGKPLLETIVGGKPGERIAAHDGLLAMLQGWDKTLLAAGARIALKAHRFQILNTHPLLAELLKEVGSPRIVAVFDPSHEPDPRVDPALALASVLKRLAFVHIKDVDWATSPQKDARFVLPGQGKLNWPAFASALRSSGFSGPVCVEVSRQIWDTKGFDALAAAKSSIAFLSNELRVKG